MREIKYGELSAIKYFSLHTIKVDFSLHFVNIDMINLPVKANDELLSKLLLRKRNQVIRARLCQYEAPLVLFPRSYLRMPQLCWMYFSLSYLKYVCFCWFALSKNRKRLRNSTLWYQKKYYWKCIRNRFSKKKARNWNSCSWLHNAMNFKCFKTFSLKCFALEVCEMKKTL